MEYIFIMYLFLDPLILILFILDVCDVFVVGPWFPAMFCDLSCHEYFQELVSYLNLFKMVRINCVFQVWYPVKSHIPMFRYVIQLCFLRFHE